MCEHVLGILIPACVQTLYIWEERKRILCYYIVYKNVLLSLVAIVMMAVGSFASIGNILEEHKHHLS